MNNPFEMMPPILPMPPETEPVPPETEKETEPPEIEKKIEPPEKREPLPSLPSLTNEVVEMVEGNRRLSAQAGLVHKEFSELSERELEQLRAASTAFAIKAVLDAHGDRARNVRDWNKTLKTPYL